MSTGIGVNELILNFNSTQLRCVFSIVTNGEIHLAMLHRLKINVHSKLPLLLGVR